MFKIFFLFLTSTIFLFSKPIQFKEEKYIYALQSSFFKNGILQIYDNSLEIRYPKRNKSFIFNKDNIIERNDEKEEILSYEDNLELSIFSKIIESIYKNQPEKIKNYFEIKKNDASITLLPNDYISNVINRIEYEKNKDKLKFLRIYFVNEDWINIVETN